jgi:osmotically-inducible protein OsmY
MASAQLSAPITYAHSGSQVLPGAHVVLTTQVSEKPAVLDKVQRALAASSYQYLRRVSCAYDDGVLTLRGCMPTFYMKQTLQVLVAKVEGVRQIVNLVEVVNPISRS